MKPQDIIILLKKTTSLGKNLNVRELASSLNISTSNVSESLERCKIAQLIDINKKHVNILALQEFLIHGIKYVFPITLGKVVRGTATFISASPLKETISTSKDQYVWPYNKGNSRGQSIEPLYNIVPKIVEEDNELYQLLVLVDALRIGRVREREIAILELKKRLSNYGNI